MFWPTLVETRHMWTRDCFMWGDLGGWWIHVSRLWPTNWGWWLWFWLKIDLGFFFIETERQLISIFIALYHGTIKVSKKSISQKLIGIFPKRASALSTKTYSMVQKDSIKKEHQQYTKNIPKKSISTSNLNCLKIIR